MDQDTSHEEKQATLYVPSRRLRRNSISLPERLNDESVILNQSELLDEEETTSCASSMDVINDEENIQIPERSARRKSVMPGSAGISPTPLLQINNIDLDGDVEDGSGSEHHSITSINSISSLLKEKLTAMSLPGMLKRKKPKDYKLRAFVGILFLMIVCLVAVTHVLYNQQVLQRAYFDRFRFNKEARTVRVYDPRGREVAWGRLGIGLDLHSHAFRCLAEHERSEEGAVCMEWMNRARLYLSSQERGSLRCYQILWQSVSPDYEPMDCFDWSEGRGHWYGGGQTASMSWPLETGQVISSPFVTGNTNRHQWGNVLKRFFLNSQGVTISIDNDTPLYISINENDNQQLCLQARYDNFAYIVRKSPYLQLNYSLCTAKNMKEVHSTLADKNLWDGLKKEDLEKFSSLLMEPVWQLTPINSMSDIAVFNYTQDVIDLKFFRLGHVLVDAQWQRNLGDLTFDPTRFATISDTMTVVHRRGFRVLLTVQPFISTDSANFHEAVREGLLVRERDTENSVPALTTYNHDQSVGVLDITNNSSLPWLQQRLRKLVEDYELDGFYLDMGTAYDMPHYYRFEEQLINPDQYKTLLTESVLRAVSVAAVSGAVTMSRAPVFVSLPPFASSWEALNTIIPTILTYGVIGYPFLMPGAVGGDYFPDQEMGGNFTDEVRLPDQELYERWLQVATFLPVIRYTHLPSKYGNDTLLEMAKILTALRYKTVNTLLKKYLREALESGIPIIRPLWMLDPNDPACHMVVDEFSIGEELIVAPVLVPKLREREVYLPSGVWKDGMDGSLRKGNRWLHHYPVPPDKIAYFVKMPDNTRF